MSGPADAERTPAFAAAREAMVREIEREARATANWVGSATLDPRVLEALRRVPRHEFVPSEEQGVAYDNRPLPIGCGQTISQPYIVALMTHLARVQPGARVLEIGTGCGYQAAVLAELAERVHSIEFEPALAESARERLVRLGYHNVEVRCGDGYAGWPEAAPFNAVLVAAAAPTVPQPLVEQLAARGRLVIPVGRPYGDQELLVLEKDDAGETALRRILPVAFVPLRRAS